jgi:hypothetical protein
MTENESGYKPNNMPFYVGILAAVVVILAITAGIVYGIQRSADRKQQQYNACLDSGASASECALVRKVT